MHEMKSMLGSFVYLALVAVIAAHAPKGFNGPSIKAFSDCAATFCKAAGDVLLVPVGDVNGDGFEDLICHKSSGQIQVALNNKQGRFNSDNKPAGGIEKGWCKGPKQKAFVGDFDGDKRADLLCHSYQKGSKDVRVRSKSGNSYSNPKAEEAFTGWCYHTGAELFVADFDGDGKADLLCHDNKGQKWLAKSLLPQGGFVQKQYNKMGWCYHKSAILYVADSNGDSSADIVCHDDAGTTWIVNTVRCTGSACYTQFNTKAGHGIQGRKGFCPGNTSGPMPRYYLIDFNGDGKADEYCHKTNSKQFNSVITGSPGFRANAKYAWQCKDDYCNKKGDSLIFGRFFGSKRDDLLCVSGKTYLLRRNHGV